MPFRTLTTDRLRRQLAERIPPRILDVRSEGEFAHAHLPGALNIPLADLERRAREIDPLVDLVVVSEHGVSSYRACEWLYGRGYLKVVNLLEGMAEFGNPLF